MKRIIFMTLCLFLCSELYSQETRYIRDELYVPLRSGQTLQHRIVHKGLASGTRLTVLETNNDSGYSKVRTDKGTEGWVQTQYLSIEPAGRELYQQAQQSIAKLQEQNNKLIQQLADVKMRYEQAKKEIDQLTIQNNTVRKELENITKISANAITLDSDNKTLLKENQDLKNRTEILLADKKRLQDDKENDAFLNGAFAVLIGVMITLIVPMLRSKKSSSWA